MIGADPFDQIERMLLSGEHDSPTARLGDIASLSEHHKTLIEAETAIATSLPLQSVLSQVEDTIAALENSAAPNGQDILMARLQIVRAVALASTGRQAAARSILLDLQQAASPSAAIRYRLMRELGRLCMERGDLDEALALFVRALVVARAEEDSFRQEIVLFDIARGYQNRGRNNTALDILGGLRAAFPSSTVIGARLATYSARSRLNLKQYDSAFEDIEPAIGFYASKAPTSDYHSLALVERARHQAGTGQTIESTHTLNQAKELANTLQNEGLCARIDLALGEVQFDAGQSSDAINTLLPVFSYFDEIATPFYRIATARALGRAYHAERDMALAEKFYSIALSEARRKRLSKICYEIRSTMETLSIEESAIHTSRRLLDEGQPGVSGYVLGKKIGAGGFGTVYRAYDTDHNRTVAVKIVELSRLYDNPTRNALRKSLATEYEAASRIRHPGCVRIHAFGDVENGDLFVVQDLVAGVGLDRLMLEEHSERQRRSVLIKIVDAISALHGAGVIHRDLKPENILVDDGMHPVLIDFGIARLSEEETAFRGYGSLHYMAPEQLVGRRTTEAADWFSFGVFALEWLGGLNPITIKNSRGKSKRKIISRREYAAQSNCPEGLARALYPLLERNPQRRLNNAAKIIQKIKQA